MRGLNADWIEYMKAYRIYDPKYSQQTIAYEEDLTVAEQRVKEDGYSLTVTGEKESRS